MTVTPIYLDNAATTFPKPVGVYSEVCNCMLKYGGNPGRSGHRLSLDAANKIFMCREALAEFLGVGELERIAFSLNTTYALNTVIKGLLNKGDHVLISDIEHNAVLRPIRKLSDAGIITYDVFPSLINATRRSPTLVCAKIASMLRKNTRMVICNHASNICSATMPIKEIADFCRKRGIYFVVDAAQSAGHHKIVIDEMNISALCLPSHKGLYGPQGAGIIALGRDVLPETLFEGGSGINSANPSMPAQPPERYEAGTLPTPAIAGLCEGVRYISGLDADEISSHEAELYRCAKEGLCNIDGAHIYASSYSGANILFNIGNIPSETTARLLDSYGICTRAGFHCSPLAHKTLGTPDHGAVRASFGIFNTKKDVDSLISALSKISAEYK